ncbi:hypothetical protein ACFWCB_20450 [Streptomyces sp. NPDC060048]|uniref:hypothetical protein n=1 Tax=unclassified Streptomyces TaxID=2593676 RepID=UPI003676AE61
MSETTPNSKGPAPAQYKPTATEPAANYDDTLKRIDAQAAELAKSLEQLKDAPEATRAAAVNAVKPHLTGFYTNWSHYESGRSSLIPAEQVKPEDIGTLSIEDRGGKPVIVVSGGKYVPAELSVVHVVQARQKNIFLAKVSDQAERYDEMISYMKEIPSGM